MLKIFAAFLVMINVLLVTSVTSVFKNSFRTDILKNSSRRVLPLFLTLHLIWGSACSYSAPIFCYYLSLKVFVKFVLIETKVLFALPVRAQVSLLINLIRRINPVSSSLLTQTELKLQKNAAILPCLVRPWTWQLTL